MVDKRSRGTDLKNRDVQPKLILKEIPLPDRFPIFVDLVLRLEGDYTNNPDDRGGETKYGITKYLLNQLNKSDMFDTLTIEQAKGIYKSEFYDHVRPVLSTASHYSYFDIAVNSGPQVYLACKESTKDDYAKIKAWREDCYQKIVEHHPEQMVFLHGWMNRLTIINDFFTARFKIRDVS